MTVTCDKNDPNLFSALKCMLKEFKMHVKRKSSDKYTDTNSFNKINGWLKYPKGMMMPDHQSVAL